MIGERTRGSLHRPGEPNRLDVTLCVYRLEIRAGGGTIRTP